MFCIINLRHNSSYVAPPAGGRHLPPPLPPTPPRCTHLLSNEIFVYSRIRLSATSMLHRLHRDLVGNKDRVIAWENGSERWIFISMKVVVPSISVSVYFNVFFACRRNLISIQGIEIEKIQKNR